MATRLSIPELRQASAVAAIALLAMLLVGCKPAEQDRPVMLFAAASTAELVADLVAKFEQASGIRVQCNVASSSTLARQIENGAACDLFISANPQWLDYLAKRGCLADDSWQVLFSNALVIIVSSDSAVSIDIESGFPIGEAVAGRWALGDPDHVPAGIYAREALIHMGWWDQLKDRIVPCMDVRSALAMVETGQANAGIVYATDAAMSSKVRVVGTLRADSHTPIRYGLGRCRHASAQSNELRSFLIGPQAIEVYRGHGFAVLDGGFRHPPPEGLGEPSTASPGAGRTSRGAS